MYSPSFGPACLLHGLLLILLSPQRNMERQPLLAVYVSLMMEAIGDITASSGMFHLFAPRLQSVNVRTPDIRTTLTSPTEVSRLEVDGPEFDKRIQGGVLADGFNGIIAALMTVTPREWASLMSTFFTFHSADHGPTSTFVPLALLSPVSVFAQNNGVIALTRCANRRAGYFACFWLILFGMLGKIAGVVLSIPKSVLGGVTTFLFASVTVSGIRVLAFVKWTRRTRYVLACALSVGLGNLLVPTWSEYLFTYEGGNKALSSFLDRCVPYLTPSVQVRTLLNSHAHPFSASFPASTV